MGTRKRVGTLATLLILILTLTPGLQAQGRGGGRGGGMGGRVAPASPNIGRPASPFAVGRPVAPFVSPPVGPLVGPRVVNPNNGVTRGRSHFGGPRTPFFGSRRNGIVSQPFFGGFGGYAPYYWPDPFYSPYYSTPSYVDPGYLAPQDSTNDDLSDQVQRLSQEIQDLRLQEEALAASRMQPPPPPPPSTPEPPPTPTVFVFRDGHRVSIQNYAIVGSMLWVLDERTSTKIPLADLDLDATQKINRGNGVRFSLGR